jgi:hypothetical protein
MNGAVGDRAHLAATRSSDDPRAGAGQRDIAEQVRERCSRTAHCPLPSNGCHRCSAPFGASYVNDRILETAAANGASLDEFPALLTAPVSAARWTALVEARSSVIG